MKADPDRACLHENFQANVEVHRITASDDDPTIVAYKALVRVWCQVCEETFRWIGVQAGDVPNRPMVSVDEAELRAPIRPASSDPDFGLGIPGFAVGYREAPPSCTSCRREMTLCSRTTNPSHVQHDAEDEHYVCPNGCLMTTGREPPLD